jgi:hypothetical protein
MRQQTARRELFGIPPQSLTDGRPTSLDDTADAELVRQAIDGHCEAFAEIYRRYHTVAYRFARMIRTEKAELMPPPPVDGGVLPLEKTEKLGTRGIRWCNGRGHASHHVDPGGRHRKSRTS